MRKRRANMHVERAGRQTVRSVGLDDGERELLELYRSLPPPLRERLLDVVRLVARPDGQEPQE
ncbi:MAG: hypothetical protein BIFFINMI_00592 [Phycisphaerae bacterium]|nr:hypothetical protein [Phycisphaerae bacterium]